MSSVALTHDLRKFSDHGLQLRLPVDLIPPGQYGQLTNAIPRIEGELRARDGLSFIAHFTQAGIPLLQVQPGAGFVNLVFPFDVPSAFAPPFDFLIGQVLIVTITDGGGVVNPGVYVTHVGSLTANFALHVEIMLVFNPLIPTIGSPTVGAFYPVVGSVQTLPLTAIPAIHTIHRLNESVPSIPSNRIVGAGLSLFVARLDDPTNFRQLAVSMDGSPLSIIDFRFTRDTATWAILTDGSSMWKYRDGPEGETLAGQPIFFFEALGNAPPTVAADATVNGAGNLNSTGGTGYDWRYTYVNGQTFTESNPSPITVVGGSTVTTRPAAFTNPAIPGQQPFANPTNAFTQTGVPSIGEAFGFGTGPAAGETCSCQWKSWALPPAGTVKTASLFVDAAFSVTFTPPGSGAALLQYSVDNGLSWQSITTVLVANGSKPRQTYQVTLPNSIAFNRLRVRCLLFAASHGPGGSVRVGASIYDMRALVTVDPVLVATTAVNQSVNVCVTPSPLAEHDYINLYRRGGSLTDAWRLVGQFAVSDLVQGACSASQLQINDNVSDTTLSTEAIMELDNDQPVTSVSVINQPVTFFWGPVGLEARVLACGDPGRPECVYFSKPGNADSWPPQNFIEVSSPGTPIIAGCIYGTRTFAYSSDRIWELVEGLPGATFSPFITPATHGLISPWGLCVADAMYFVSKDGIYRSDGGMDTSIVENDIKPLFPTYDAPGEDVEGYEAVDMTQPDQIRLRYHNGEVYFVYAGLTTGLRRMLIYDILKRRWRAAQYTCAISEVYSEPGTVSSLLMGTTGGSLYQAGGDTDPNELDEIENAGFMSVVAVGVTLAAGDYFALMTRLTAAGETAISPEQGTFLVDATHAIQASFPAAVPGQTAWRVYYGTTFSAENQYQEFSESQIVTDGRVEVISTAGTAGTLPTLPPSHEIAVVLRTGARDQGSPLNRKQYDNYLIDLDPGGANGANPVTITPYINGEAQARAAIQVTGSGRQQVPLDLSDFFAFNVELQVAWKRALVGGAYTDPVLFQDDLLHYLEPVGLKHWALQPSSSGFPGFMHCRDAYIAIRSTADVTLTMILDGVTTQTYIIPSTGGVRQRVYVQFQSNKAKQYQWNLDSTEEFRCYAEDTEMRIKPWLGLLGYQVQREWQEAR